MHGSRRRWLAASLVLSAGYLTLSTSAINAQDHVVSSADLSQAVARAVGAREAHVKQIDRFLASPGARQALDRAHLNPTEVTRAVSSLSDQDLARFAARAERAQQDLAAGARTNEQLTDIIIPLATAVIILVIVER